MLRHGQCTDSKLEVEHSRINSSTDAVCRVRATAEKFAKKDGQIKSMHICPSELLYAAQASKTLFRNGWFFLITRRWQSLRYGGEVRNKTCLVSLPSDLIECVSVGAAERRASINECVQNIELSTQGSLKPRGNPSTSLPRGRPRRALLKI